MEGRKPEGCSGCVTPLIVIAVILVVGLCIRGCINYQTERDKKLREEERRRYWEEAVASISSGPKPAATPAPTPIRPEDLDIPVVGMKEEDINKTKHPWKLRETTSSVWPGHEYVHYSDRHDKTVTLTLTCFNGYVSEVNDYRKAPLRAYGGLGRDPHTKSPYTKKPVRDEYGSPEEFYEEHREEFEDFDEAEEEYYEEYYGG